MARVRSPIWSSSRTCSWRQDFLPFLLPRQLIERALGILDHRVDIRRDHFGEAVEGLADVLLHGGGRSVSRFMSSICLTFA